MGLLTRSTTPWADGSSWSRWAQAGTLVRRRFSQARLGVTAGSLTFTTLLALVPLLAVMLAVFTAFPSFSNFQDALQRLLVQNLVPDTIARPVMAALTQFAGKASRIGALGLVVLMATALALMLTIDRTLNALWQVRRTRPLGQRLLLYWTALTLGPLLLGASLSGASYALSASKGLASALPGGFGLLIDLAQFALLAAVAAGLYHYVPHTPVRWAHAWVGGVFVALAVEAAKKALGWYVLSVPAITSIYGAFAFVPLLLLWIYLLWVVVLMGAVITASLPALLAGLPVAAGEPGEAFERAVAVLSQLALAREDARQGLAVPQLAQALHLDPLYVQAAVESLARIGWVSQLDEGGSARWVLLAEPSLTSAQALLQDCLLAPGEATRPFRERAGWHTLKLADLLQRSD